MGCDIHLEVEVRGDDGKWRQIEVSRICGVCEGTGRRAVNSVSHGCSWCWNDSGIKSGFDTRNYDTFSILAGVRGTLTPIAEPRGLPEDRERVYNREYDEEYEEYGDHSFSWLSLEEMLAFDWNQQARHSGWVSLKTFAEWDASGRSWPSTWSGGVGGGNVRYIDNEQMRCLVSTGYDGPLEYFTQVEWSDSYAKSAGEFYSEFLPALVALSQDPKDVRIVFGFDS